jgi:hypothetical protein
MVRKPGFVSREFANGRTVKYLKPASAFFILNLFYFFFPVIQLFNASLKTQLNAPHGRLIKEILARKIAHMGMNLDSFAFIYNIKTVSLAKMMVMVFVFLAALPLNLLYAKRNRFFNDHLHYTTELATFNLLVNALGLTIVVSTLGLGKYLNEEVFTGIFITTNLYFVIRSGIVFYNEKGWLLIVKSALIILSLIVGAGSIPVYFILCNAVHAQLAKQRVPQPGCFNAFTRLPLLRPMTCTNEITATIDTQYAREINGSAQLKPAA